MIVQALLIGRDRGDSDRWVSLLKEAGCAVHGPIPRGDPSPFSKARAPDVAVLTQDAHVTSLLECVQRLKLLAPALPLIVLSDPPELFATSHCGPFEGVICLPPDVQAPEMAEALTRALTPTVFCKCGSGYPVIIGRSTAIQEIRKKVRTVANTDIAVLITGESGTGKELIAQAIHCHSRRLEGPLVKISCGVLPDDLLESEVFGYQRGAFTGAFADKSGRLETADGGTLFLDEVGDLSWPLQVKFLQVLEEKAVSRLGDTEEKVVDTRIVAATNADLEARMARKEFRKDLFYRLSVIRIQTPPLRDHLEDVPLLVHYYLNKYCLEMGRPVLGFPATVAERLSAYAWPGNVRELENLVRRAVATQGWDFLDQALKEGGFVREGDAAPDSRQKDRKGFPLWPEHRIRTFLSQEGGSLKALVQAYAAELEKEAVQKALDDAHWNRKKAARLLKVSYKTLLNRITSLQLQDH